MLIHEYQAKALLREYGIPVARSKPAFTVEEAVAAAKELGGEREMYLGIVIDRRTGRPVVMASAEGGVDIEEVAATKPEAILKEMVDPAVGMRAYQGRKLGTQLGLPKNLVNGFAKIVMGLYRLFDEKDASMVEINPLLITDEGKLHALDAKINFDGSGLFRHPDIAAMRDVNEEDPIEVRAGEHGLSYVNLTGNIGCMVNGAGLAMSTMDIIKYYGGEPANFLDVGGSATTEAVTEAFKLILADKRVEAVLVNIFGGIMKCDTIAAGIIQAVKEVEITVPLVVRLEGTNVELGRKMLDESGLALTTAGSMADAAEKVVAATRKQ